MFWYVHKPGQTIKMMLQEFTKKEDIEEEYNGRLFYNIDRTNKKFPLNITNVRVSDTGTYYCVSSDTLCDVHEQDVQKSFSEKIYRMYKMITPKAMLRLVMKLLFPHGTKLLPTQ
uniref:Ig-like domain-containing protein n=1 Tax=Pyxicephalus adspersus TaxID=30357 RepID=A0AAV3AAR3_PYXAD|nr:TPA: hypothetical protein GDO54_013625 [Pyxicephalus adspersus]